MAVDKLTAKQQLFVAAYMGAARGNATEAARLAGYKGNEDTLKSVGCENLTKPYIKKAIKARLDSAKGAMGADEILAELADIARADWREFVQIRYGREGQVIDATLPLKDKIKALELLGKHRKLFVERHELSGPDGSPLKVYSGVDPERI